MLQASITIALTVCVLRSVHIGTAVAHFVIYFPFRASLRADFSDESSSAARAKFAFYFAWRYLLMRLSP